MSKASSAVANIVSNISSHYQSSTIPKVSPPPQFFEHAKKGEVNELKQLLKNTLNEKDQNKRRDVVKKVIAFMTLGIDVSRLFSEMCMASFTSDLIQKKMIYLYLGNYAESHSDLAIMAMNTFLKDCQHADGKIRGLALRSLCSMRFSGSFEYAEPAILEALKDPDPYVRKTAIMGCIKLFYSAPAKIKKSSIIDSLYALIKDSDTLVIANSIQALNEILQDEGGMATSTKMVVYLLNRIKEFSEWGQTVILELVAQYVPKSENELYDIMNLLEDRLKHSCTSIVLGCIKVFLNFTLDKPQLHQQVFKRIQSPLITLMTSGEVIGTYELTFTALSHIFFIVTRGGNSVFENDYKQFYCKVDEPTYIKLLKLDILTQIASENNLGDILNELGEYVTDIDTNIARKSIQALGGIAIRLPKMATPIVKQLTTFIAMQSENVTNETIIAFRDILRKYPTEYKEIIQIINNSLENITEADAKIALVWILGDFGEHIDDAPYIFESLVNGIKEGKSNEIDNTKVKHTLLTSGVKLFLKRAPEMQLSLGNLFHLILSNEKEDIDLKDRAAFYYRIMQANIDELFKIMNDAKQEITMFLEDEENSKENSNIEFNTLSVIYQKPANKFIKSFAHFNIQRNKELAILEAASKLKPEEAAEESNKQETPEPVVEKKDDLLDVGEIPSHSNQKNENISQNHNLLDLNFGPSMTSISVGDLVENIEIDSDFFQNSWMNLNEGATLTRVLKGNFVLSLEPSFVENLFNQFRVNCIASGQMEGEMKFYFFSKHAMTGKFIFLEFQINKITNIVNLIVKSEDDELAAFYSKYIEKVLIENDFI